MTGRTVEKPAEVSAPKEASKPKKAEKAKVSAEAGDNDKKESQGGLFPDLSNLAPPPEELKVCPLPRLSHFLAWALLPAPDRSSCSPATCLPVPLIGVMHCKACINRCSDVTRGRVRVL